MGTRLRRSALVGSLLASACSPVARHPIGEAPPATIHPRADELLVGSALYELPPVHFHSEQSEVHRPWPGRVADRGFLSTDDTVDALVPDPDGLLVYERPHAPALQPGGRLVVVHETGGTTELEVTERRCPPSAPDCLDCDARWARRVSGRALEPRDGEREILAAPRDARFSFAWSPTQPESGRAVLVTSEGVQLREYFDGTGRVADYAHDGIVRALPFTRVISAGSRPQLFGVIAWPGTQILSAGPLKAIGGRDLVVVNQWVVGPSVPVRDASYWILGRESVVGRLRFDPPYATTDCSFSSNRCWAMTPVDLPSVGTRVVAVAGPIPDGAPKRLAVRVKSDTEGDVRQVSVGSREAPLFEVDVSTFDCRSQSSDGSRPGLCAEANYGAADRRVTFFATDVHHARPEIICASVGG